MFKLGVDLPVLRAGYLNLNFIVSLIYVIIEQMQSRLLELSDLEHMT